MRPFVKWAGGKRQILSTIIKFIEDAIDEGNKDSYTYIEPFLGGGAIFFDLMPQRAIINDLNADLMNAYRVIRSGDCNRLIEKLKEYDESYRKDCDEFYYEMRQRDREPNWLETDAVVRAARMIFLNKTCYNGLYRVNGKGQFNTPIGRYSNPTICDEQTILDAHNYLSNPQNEIAILNDSYELAFDRAKDGDVIYVDPPYDYQDDDGFTKYQMAGFSFSDFEKLKGCCDKAIDKGATVIISNNATEKVIELFSQDPKYRIYYNVTRLSTLRMINCKVQSRRTGEEVIILGALNSLPQANDIEKVITFACKCNDDYLNDTKQICIDLDLGTERQAAYYLSALQFLGYITQQRTVSTRLLALNGERGKIEEDIFNQLKENNLLGALYTENIDQSNKIKKGKIEEIIKEKYPTLSSSTIERRASTIKAWLEWMLTYERQESK